MATWVRGFLIVCMFCTNLANAGSLTIMRHGRAQDDHLNIYNTNPDHSTYREMPLTWTGKGQANNAGQIMKDRKAKYGPVYASPLPKALETAKLVLERLGWEGIALYTHPAIRERDAGSLEGTSRKNSLDHPRKGPAETLESVRQRVRQFLRETVLPDTNKGANVFVVSHESVCRVMLQMLGQRVVNLEYGEFIRIEDPSLTY